MPTAGKPDGQVSRIFTNPLLRELEFGAWDFNASWACPEDSLLYSPHPIFATQLHRLICIFATMKFLAFILSIYIFALNLAPCADYSVPDDEVETEISQAIGDDHQHQDSDLCSPFCSCQCCHINATHFEIADIELDIKLISTLDFFYLNGSEKDINTSILQPPRV